jgi:hypothetical protein
MRRVFLCLLFVLGLLLAGCAELRGERYERGERIHLGDETQRMDVTVVQ